mmetsp:Transcript_26344/g.53504  ORF Transcript_26344/g.53504 Transcript_26344/m.53504 type:complete len:189 (+) Transcript_26344:573-1139(+)
MCRMAPIQRLPPAVLLVLVVWGSLLGQCESYIIGISHKRHCRTSSRCDIRSIPPCISATHRCYKDGSSRLFNSNNDEESEKTPLSTRNDTSQPEEDNNKPNVGQKVGFGLLTGFGYVTQAVSWLISAGLLLNLFGYGYQFNKEEGIHIDTLQQIRADNQFKVEYERIGRGMDLSTKQRQRTLPTATED